MKYLSVCSGIEAATVAWHPLGWQSVAYSEIEPFPCAVLAHHYPTIQNLGDMTQFKGWDSERLHSIDVLAGGTPCQSFSIAGLRQGLSDPRGNLMLTYLAIAERFKPRWIVWENVPGVLSSNRGRDFGTFLGALAELGYGFAYRVLDAQYFGVAQRRRRVFVVGYLGDWRRAAEVLFEPESLHRDSPPSRKTRQEVTETAGTLASTGGGLSRPAGNANELDFCVVAGTLKGGSGKRGYPDPADSIETMTLSPAVRAKANSSHRGDSEAYVPDISPAIKARDHKGPSSDGDGDGAAIITATYPINTQIAMRHEALGRSTGFGIGENNDPSFTLQANHSHAVAHTLTKRSDGSPDGTGRGYNVTTQGMSVRRLTPRECERLQGFPDDYTLIPWKNKPASGCPDGPRYKALGNSMAVPVMRWIGKRIAEEARE